MGEYHPLANKTLKKKIIKETFCLAERSVGDKSFLAQITLMCPNQRISIYLTRVYGGTLIDGSFIPNF